MEEEYALLISRRIKDKMKLKEKNKEKEKEN